MPANVSPPHHQQQLSSKPTAHTTTYLTHMSCYICGAFLHAWPSRTWDGWGERSTNAHAGPCFPPAAVLLSRFPSFTQVPLATDANRESLLCQNKTTNEANECLFLWIKKEKEKEKEALFIWSNPGGEWWAFTFLARENKERLLFSSATGPFVLWTCLWRRESICFRHHDSFSVHNAL